MCLTDFCRIKEKISALKREDYLIFPLFSDIHVNGKEDEALKKLNRAVKLICDEIKPDMVINLGDILSMLGRSEHISDRTLVKKLKEVCDSVKENVNCPLYIINGNHDGAGTDFFKPELWNELDIDGYADGKLIREKGKSYFYLDAKETRFVFLSIPSDSDTDGQLPAPVWAFGKEQLDWLENEALNTKKDVLLFSHVPFFSGYRGDMERMIDAWTGNAVKKAYVFELSGQIDDKDEAVKIIEKAKNVVACFSGHMHKDSFWAPYEMQEDRKNPLPCHQVVTKNPVAFSWQADKYDLAVDIVLWNYKERKISVLRMGDGQDKEFFV